MVSHNQFLHLISTTRWADRRASSLMNSSQTFRNIPAVSCPNGSSLSSPTGSPPPQLQNTSFRDSKAIPQDPHHFSHINRAVAIRSSSRTVPPANWTRISSNRYFETFFCSATRMNLPTTYSTSSTTTRMAQSTLESSFAP